MGVYRCNNYPIKRLRLPCLLHCGVVSHHPSLEEITTTTNVVNILQIKEDPEDLQPSSPSSSNAGLIPSFGNDKLAEARCHSGQGSGQGRQLKCSVCSATFFRNPGQNTRLKTYMGEVFVCDGCSPQASFSSTHTTPHAGENLHRCEVCSSMFVKKTSLERHMVVHTGKVPECKLCDATFSDKNTLKAHMQEQHGERTFRCQTCCASFFQSRGLKCHMRIHSRVKSLPCKLPTAACARPECTIERPFECELCPNSFTRSTHLKNHMMSHARARIFKCKVCSLLFADGSEFRAHEETHVQKKP